MVHLVLLRSLLYLQAREDRKSKLKERKRKNQKSCTNKEIPCRICNRRNGDIPIFNNSLKINIPQEIQYFSNVEILSTDKFSKYLCKHCLERLDGCIRFRKLCQKTNDYLLAVTPKNKSDIQDTTIHQTVAESEDDSTGHIDDTVNEPSNIENNAEENYSLPSPDFSEEFKFYNCPNCEQPFPELDKYNYHVLMCNGQAEVKNEVVEPAPKRRFLCDICGKTISTLATLYIHMKIHRDIFPFHCDECPYRGRTVDLLRVHKRIHMTEKPYKCTLCSKTATTASNLQRHMRNAHSTSRPFKCTHCDRSYRLQSDVDKHIKIAHNRQRTVNCPICDKTLSSINALSKHRLKVHKIKGRNGRVPSYLQCEAASQDMEGEYT